MQGEKGKKAAGKQKILRSKKGVEKVWRNINHPNQK